MFAFILRNNETWRDPSGIPVKKLFFKEKNNKKTALCTRDKTNTHCQCYSKILRKQWHLILELYSRDIHILYKYTGTFTSYDILITYIIRCKFNLFN